MRLRGVGPVATPRPVSSSRRVLPLLALAACLGATNPAAAIVGSSRDSDLADRLVMVLQRRGPAAGFCTGIVIGPRAVLTAAHCVPPGADLRIHYRDGSGAPVLLETAGVVRHPGYRADAVARRKRSVDLAVVTLPAPLPDRFRPAALSATAVAAPGERFRIAGFGVAREGEAASSGQLREAELAARAPLSAVLLWIEDPSHRGAGACTGDSGGPVLDIRGDVVALTLWSAGAAGKQCGALTQALWLAPYRDWIAGAAAP